MLDLECQIARTAILGLTFTFHCRGKGLQYRVKWTVLEA